MSGSILFVHQGFELYGSDRTFIQSIQATADRWPEARITVLLPGDGALRAALLDIVSDVRVVDLAILRKSDLKGMRLRDTGRFLAKIAEARRMMRNYDVTYINTLVVMDYILAAFLVRQPRIVHVHEIPTGDSVLLGVAHTESRVRSIQFSSDASKIYSSALATLLGRMEWRCGAAGAAA